MVFRHRRREPLLLKRIRKKPEALDKLQEYAFYPPEFCPTKINLRSIKETLVPWHPPTLTPPPGEVGRHVSVRCGCPMSTGGGNIGIHAKIIRTTTERSFTALTSRDASSGDPKQRGSFGHGRCFNTCCAYNRRGLGRLTTSGEKQIQHRPPSSNAGLHRMRGNSQGLSCLSRRDTVQVHLNCIAQF